MSLEDAKREFQKRLRVDRELTINGEAVWDARKYGEDIAHAHLKGSAEHIPHIEHSRPPQSVADHQMEIKKANYRARWVVQGVSEPTGPGEWIEQLPAEAPEQETDPTADRERELAEQFRSEAEAAIDEPSRPVGDRDR